MGDSSDHEIFFSWSAGGQGRYFVQRISRPGRININTDVSDTPVLPAWCNRVVAIKTHRF